MNLVLRSTSRIVEVEGADGHTVPGRVWEGRTDAGVPVFVVVTRLAVREDHDQAAFERELITCPHSPASAESARAIPARLIL